MQATYELPRVLEPQPMTKGRKKRQGEIDLASRGIALELVAEMRNRVINFEEDWNAPGMEVYDEL